MSLAFRGYRYIVKKYIYIYILHMHCEIVNTYFFKGISSFRMTFFCDSVAMFSSDNIAGTNKPKEFFLRVVFGFPKLKKKKRKDNL